MADNPKPEDIKQEEEVIAENTPPGKDKEDHTSSEAPPSDGKEMSSQVVKPKFFPGQKEDPGQKASNIEKFQSEKLLSKYPSLGNRPPQSKMLQKRVNKGRMFFDSGDYNMTKVKEESRVGNKVVSRAPQRLVQDPHSSGGESHDDEESDDEIDPSRQAVPTTDLLFMRRAAKHMPMGSAGPKTTRRSTMAPPGMGGGGFARMPSIEGMDPDELVSEGPVCNPKVMARRRATLQVPSKLA